MSRLAALTGGTGFLGRHTIRALADAGWRIRILTRSAPHLPELADVPIELIPGDLGDPTALRRLCTGADAVVHIAGLVKAPSRGAFMAANADGTAALVDAWQGVAAEADFTLVSSMAARAPDLSDYAASKRAGEAHLIAAAAPNHRILRPAAVYGANDSESLKVLKLANGPIQLMLNAPDARIAMIDARDAATMIAALVGTGAGGERYELTDANVDGHRWVDLAHAAAAALGRSPRPVRVPAFVLKAAGGIGGSLSALTGSPEMLTRGKVREILHPDWSGDPGAVVPASIAVPKIELPTGLTDMVAWARSANRL
ncbi:MAG: NAD-dependent epimerase/dehydratase family protein [Pseudomonadota bacterium]